MYVINPKARGEYTLKRDAILRGAQITFNGLCPLITYQSFGLDKKLSNPIGLLNFLEAPLGIGPRNKGFADPCLTAWLWRRDINKATMIRGFVVWSGLRGSNPPPSPWQGDALPNELNPQRWCLESELNQRHVDFQSTALPTELSRRIRQLGCLYAERKLNWRPGWGSNPRPLA